MSSHERYMDTVRVGLKGQVVIPRQVRAMFGILPGDLLLLLADIRNGIAIQPCESFFKIADEVFSVTSNDIKPGEPADSNQAFAREIKKAADAPKESEPE